MCATTLRVQLTYPTTSQAIEFALDLLFLTDREVTDAMRLRLTLRDAVREMSGPQAPRNLATPIRTAVDHVIRWRTKGWRSLNEARWFVHANTRRFLEQQMAPRSDDAQLASMLLNESDVELCRSIRLAIDAGPLVMRQTRWASAFAIGLFHLPTDHDLHQYLADRTGISYD